MIIISSTTALSTHKFFEVSSIKCLKVVKQIFQSISPPKKNKLSNPGKDPQLFRPVWPRGAGLSLCYQTALLFPTSRGLWELAGKIFINGSNDFISTEYQVLQIKAVVADGLFSPPEVAIHLVKIACERPERLGRSLSQWDCLELANQLIREGIVESISPETVRRILSHHKLKPWRHHPWLTPKTPRDDTFYSAISEIIDLYTRELAPYEIVLSLDEKTSLQPRPRTNGTKPALPGNIPIRVEHTYKRNGALNLFAAFNTRTGEVIGQCFPRKRQQEFISFLEHIDRVTPSAITRIHIVCDNLKVHSGKAVKEWLKKTDRFEFHFTPVHCSWMNQIEQWFGILQRKRYRFADFSSKEEMRDAIMQFISQWNENAHPFNWSTKSVAKVMANAPLKMAA